MINKLNHYSLNNPASVYDEEALTALELAGRTASKVNEVVEGLNKTIDEVNDRLTEQDDTISEQEKTVIPNAVYKEIGKQINNGIFDRQIEEHIGLLENRVDNMLGSVSPGSTTFDAEIIDARTDTDGNRHVNLGESVRNQIEKAIFDTNNEFIENRLNPNTVSRNVYVNPADGSEVSGDYWTTDYIRIRKGENITFYLGGNVARFLAVYDSGKNIIIRNTSQENVNRYVQNMDEAFIRISVTNAVNPSDCMVIESGVYDDFIPYGERVKRTSLDADYDILSAFYYNRITDVINGHYPSHLTGELLAGVDIICTNYIKVRAGESLSCFTEGGAQMSMRTVAVYDEQGEFNVDMSGENMYTFTNTLDEPVYIRVGISTKYFAKFMIIDEYLTFFLDVGQFVLKVENSDKMVEILEEEIADLERKIDYSTNVGVETAKATSLGAWQQLTLTKFPMHIKKNMSITATAEIDVDNAYITVGRGTPTSEGSEWVYLTSNGEIGVARYVDGATKYIVGYTHGITYTKYVTITISYDNDITTVDMSTGNGHYRFTYVSNLDAYGQPFVKACGNGAKNVKISATCDDFIKPIWVFGDSYLGSSIERVYGQLLEMGVDNYLICSRSGLTTKEAQEDFYRCLSYGRPKYVIFYTGMNDGEAVDPYRQYIEVVKTTCEFWGMELILNKIPSVPSLNKELINTYIDSTGLRYIDSFKAVGGVSAWGSGMLGTDGIHPSEIGAKVLANQFIVDVPEIMYKGR